MYLQALVCYNQQEARSEVLCTIDSYEKLGAVEDVEARKGWIEEELSTLITSGQSGFDSEFLHTMLFPARIDFTFQVQETEAASGS